MSQPNHTYGPTCHLGKPATSGPRGDDDVPEMHAQFFYSALYHIDDPLSAAPTSTASDSKSAKHPARPFSALDNSCLEAAWLALGSEKDRKTHNKGQSRISRGPAQCRKIGSTVETLASKVEHINRPSGESTIPSARDPSISASKKSSSRVPKRLSRFSADASSEQPPLQATHSSDEDHNSCKSKPGHCDFGSCPKAFILAKSSPDVNLLPSTKKTGKSKEICNAPGYATKDSDGDVIKPTTDPDTYAKNDAHQGNVYNSRCDDPRHVSLDFKAPGCCSDYEGNKSQPPHDDPKSREKAPIIPTSVKCELGDCQGDAANELADKLSPSFEGRKSAQSLTVKLRCDMNSKEHQSFAKHLQAKHPDVQKSEPTAGKQKASEKGPVLSTPLDLTNSPEQVSDVGTTGRPFLKLPSRPTTPQSPLTNVLSHKEDNLASGLSLLSHSSKIGRSREECDSSETEEISNHKCKAHKNTKAPVDVPVGASRLHKVCLPALHMEPIYWSPVNDVASVIRGTWFYKDTMLPVEPSVANQLEMGYREMRPWSQTWKDEMRSALEVGAAGEEKVAHRLWPKDENKPLTSDDILSTNPFCAARCFQGEPAAEGTVDLDDFDKTSSNTRTVVKRYPNCQVIYRDSRNAFILKPNLQPSAYHKRRPIYKINKGLTIGIHVCRGFNRRVWEKAHTSKTEIVGTKELKCIEEHAAVSGDSNFAKRNNCPACRLQEQPKDCTDLCLVIHGIGQKLSERVESFHFTHAINAFRRSVNVEYCNDGVQAICRKDFGGVMILPVNWRSNLSFEDVDPSKEGERHDGGPNFSLKDITQPTIPAVRRMISDVMLDVPYYMSNNKDKMVQAVISEANRVYRLWCKNNPDFSKSGRVHLIAHSLGSVMAMEILSKQPTLVPKVHLDGKKASTKHLEFNTSNLFCVGSPAGLFLLLEKQKLTPRRNQNKPEAEVGDEEDKFIVGEQGTFGCLAVENIYNVMHTNDPIACRLNACADAPYAASLKEARVPSASTGFFESISNAMKGLRPGSTAPADLVIGQIPKPTLTTRMPSQLEMEVHDFTAEEKAEKKFYLLNDNGQIDYYLSSGGGPLEIQYFNMLSAHSSYWASPDFIRMLCIELGRKTGKRHCLPNMKAVKIRHKA